MSACTLAPRDAPRAMHVPTPESIARSQWTALARRCEEATAQRFADATAFHAFATREYRVFWRLFLEWSELRYEGSTVPVCDGDACEHATFFPNVRLSYAENLLRVDGELSADRPALTSRDGRGVVSRLTRGALRDRVDRLAAAFEAIGLAPGDRVVAVAHNDGAAVIAGLAATAVGATLSSVAPDMGAFSVVARFGQLAPSMLLCHLRETGDAERDASPSALTARIAEIARGLPSLRALVALDDGAVPPDLGLPVHTLAGLLAATPSEVSPRAFRRFPFNHPLFILFSSGTTGPPKCIVHGAGGTLLEHVKEHRVHGDLRPEDKLFFHTSCSWMMWNWQLSALASGAEIVLYAGPVVDASSLWRVVAEEAVTVFGTSPAYLQMSEDAGFSPARELSLVALRAVLSTGSVLSDHLFDWVAQHVGPLPLQSISGGTDILGCFVLGNPNLPVLRGESQCPSLGLDVQVRCEGADDTRRGVGELVCASPFPSRPLGFYGDPTGARFHEAYFEQNAGVWTHGDRMELRPSGAARMLGRSDSVLNVDGVRIGPAEIDRILRALPEIRASMAVEHRAVEQHAVEHGAVEPRVAATDARSRLVLLVVLAAGVTLDGALRRRVRSELALRGSPAHVPGLIVAVPDLPVTHSGKRSERAARDAVNGVRAANVDALRNPESLVAIATAIDAVRAREPLDAPSPVADDVDLERMVRSAWERTLDVTPLAGDDDFFALGGTSLLALRLCNELKRTTGRDLPPSMLLEAPTLARMTAALRDTAGDAHAAVIALTHGPGRPLFVVHGLAGDVLDLRTLAAHFGAERPLLGLRARGLDAREPPHRTVGAMAAEYLEHVRRIDPEGPYLIAGYSFGGLVAYEMARVLVAAGARVGFLGLLDTNVHDDCLPPLERVSFRVLRALHRGTQHVRRVLRDARLPDAWLDATSRAIEVRLHATCAEAPGEALANELHDKALTPAMASVEAAAWAAFAAYRPRPSTARVTFFRAIERAPDHCYAVPTWARAAGGHVSICDVPGDHFTMIREPNAAALARDMAACIRRGTAGV